MKRTQNNIGESGQTSVKVHHAPGGASNFSLSWGDQPQPVNNANKNNQKNQSNIPFGTQAPKTELPKSPVEKTPAQTTQSCIVGEPPQKTSVKVHNPPGGKSSITFG